MIELKNVCFIYEEATRAALQNVSLSVVRGEMLAVVGHNGSGKSTLAKLLNGLLLPTEGSVLVQGMDTKDIDNLINIRSRVGMVFQNPDNQLVTTIVEEDVAFGPESLGVPPEEIRMRVDGALHAVNMSDYKESAPHMLSGGQKQRVAIAGMLAMQPEVLVLDEATSMLDPEGRKDVFAVIKSLNAELCMTVIIITQLMEEAILCDRVAVMSQGSLAMLGTPQEIFRRRDALLSYGLDVPAMVAIRDDLIKGGMPLAGDPMTADELADAIVAQMQHGKGR